MNRDISKLIYDDALASYKAELEELRGYEEKNIAKDHPMLLQVQESEGYVDPFMVLENSHIYQKWWDKMMPLFHKFLDDLPEEEYQVIKEEIEERFPKMTVHST